MSESDSGDSEIATGAELKRALSLPMLTLYGLGTTVGAGIFVLIGEVAGVAGGLTPLAFLLAATLAGLAGLCFAELATRFPESGGEAVYVKEGLGSDRLALMTGFMVVLAGLTSASTIIAGFSNYASDLVPLPTLVLKLGAAVTLGLIALWGVRESVTVAAVITVAEIGALVAICAVGLPGLELSAVSTVMQSTTSGVAGASVVAVGALLAFFSFIGFEDIVNVAEETRDARKTIPRAIVLTLIVTTILYVAVSVIAITALPIDELVASPAPLSLLFERLTGLPGETISVIAVFAVLNGALIQIIMSSRVFYGLARRGWLAAWLGTVNPLTKTPARAIFLSVSIIIILVTSFPLEKLAVTTSFIALAIFALAAMALFRLKLTAPANPDGHFRVPLWLPLLTMVSIGCVVAAEFF